MKIEITITENRTGYSDENAEIVNITIKNGNWKYWDYHMETDEQIPMTINTICKSHYLSMPVKTETDMHNLALYRETGELKVIGTSVTLYDTLLEFINYRVDNAKEDFKKFGKYDWGKIHEYKATLFEFAGQYSNMTADEDVVYSKEDGIKIKIEMVE